MHDIRYYTYPINVDKKKVEQQLNLLAYKEGDSGAGLGKPIHWCPNVLDNEDEARKFITINDNGWYDQLAVQFRQYAEPTPNKKLQALSTKRANAEKALNSLMHRFHFSSVKSKLIACKHCGSKICADFLKTKNICPVCGKDMRPETVLKRIEALKAAFEASKAAENKAINEAKKKNAKCELLWLVKIEFHT